MPFPLTPLPFDKSALEPVMSAETLDYHHGKHHAAYAKKLSELLAEEKALAGASLVDVIRAAKKDGKKTLFNNAAQLWNHNFFWQSLAPDQGQKPEGKLADMITDGFGSVEGLLKAMQEEAVGHFSNGWVWLLDKGEKLEVTSLHDADTPVTTEGAKPLFTLDIWEHAYYIDYRNARPDYAKKTLASIVNWAFVAENLDGKGVSRADQEG